MVTFGGLLQFLLTHASQVLAALFALIIVGRAWHKRRVNERARALLQEQLLNAVLGTSPASRRKSGPNELIETYLQLRRLGQGDEELDETPRPKTVRRRVKSPARKQR